MIERYAAVAGLRPRWVQTVPVLTPRLASHWIGFVTPVPTGVAKPLVGSLVHEVVCKEHDLEGLVGPPPGGPLGFEEACRAALVGKGIPASSLPEPGEADPAVLTAADPDWAG